MSVPTALTIAGSDSSGGAGIQADLKTMAAFRVFGTSALTSITAQNTLGVRRAVHLPPDLVADQIDAIMEDVGADAAKTGMLPTTATVEAVADRIRHHGLERLVVDPVMVATSGSRLIEDEAASAMARLMVPLAHLVTPNVPEAETLSGVTIASIDGMKEAARAIHGLGAANVLIKGGHLEGGLVFGEGEAGPSPPAATDLLYDGEGFRVLTAPWVEGGKIHGTGCTLSAGIAAGLARGWDLAEAVSVAKDFVTRGIASALPLGEGSALVNHFTLPSQVCDDEVRGTGGRDA